MPENGCPVNAAIADLDHIIHSGFLKNPKSRRRAEEILLLMQDVAWGRAGKDHLPSLKNLVNELGDEGPDEICKTVSAAISRTLSEHHEVFASHVQTHNCATGDCVKLAPAPCQMTCPAGLDIPTYVTLIGMGRDSEAIDVIRQDNPFPWVCGLVCTRPCEFMCVRGRIDEPVSIKFLKAFAAERAMSERLYKNPDKDPDRGQKRLYHRSGSRRHDRCLLSGPQGIRRHRH